MYDINQRIMVLEHQVLQLNKMVAKLQDEVNKQSHETESLQHALSNIIKYLKMILRYGFEWVGSKLDVDHGKVKGLADNDHLQYLETFNHLIILTDNNENPGTRRTWETWNPL